MKRETKTHKHTHMKLGKVRAERRVNDT